MNLQQEKFCHEYLLDFNATKAAIRAGYSELSAYSQGHDLLKKPEIKILIEQLSKSEFEAIGLSRKRVISELAKLGFDQDLPPLQRIKALSVLMDCFPADKKIDESRDIIKENSSRAIEAIKRLRSNNELQLGS